MPFTIEASDVIRLIQQFFQEHGLDASLAALQAETGIASRSVDDIDGFIGDVRCGRWDAVLRALSRIQIEPTALISLYELVFLELAESGQIDAARMILRQSEPMQLVRESDPSKFLKLENALSTAVLSRSAGAKIDLIQHKEAKRAKIAQELASQLTSAPKGRLLTLLGEALRFQEQTGSSSSEQVKFDIFLGSVPVVRATEDAVPSVCYKCIQMASGQHVESACFSPDGSMFVVGLADGFIEVWSTVTGAPRTDIVYQGHKSDYMVMETSILCMAFSADGLQLAVGTLNGDVAVWKAATGTCIRKIPKAHPGGVSSVSFSKDGSQLLTSGYDNALRIFNLRTGALIRQFVGHTEFVNDAKFSFEGVRVLSAASDGTLRIWNARSGEQIDCIYPMAEGADHLAVTTVKAVCPVMRQPDAFVVCAQNCPLQVYGANGKQGRAFTLPSSMKSVPNFVTACSSPTGRLLYAVGDDRNLYAFKWATGELVGCFSVSEADEIINAAHHPHLNLLVTFDTHNQIKFWKAP